ncbi:hypothetical protein GCM10009612_08830 [Streptomyces beijiangensis]
MVLLFGGLPIMRAEIVTPTKNSPTHDLLPEANGVSYDLKAVIAERGLLTAAAATIAGARITPLRCGLAVMPMTDDLFAVVGTPKGDCVPGFWRLPAGFDEVLSSWSKAGPVAFVESEYFGGVGEENAAVWSAGQLALGPLHMTEDDAEPATGTPVVRALHALGIRASASEDEFQVAGLGEHRNWEDRPAV